VCHRLRACWAPLLLAALLATSAGCPDKRRVQPSPVNASKAAAAAIKMLDTDKNGKIDGAELDKCPGLKSALAEVNPSGDKYVDYDMIKTRIQQWKGSRMGRIPLHCSVLHNGAPLRNAVVRFVPEPFLGLDAEKWTAKGKTDDFGNTLLDIPAESKQDRPELPGVPPGFYRVEVTCPDPAIPAKYNTDTVLGYEVTVSSTFTMVGPRFDVDF
jgi:hypothetical protein